MKQTELLFSFRGGKYVAEFTIEQPTTVLVNRPQTAPFYVYAVAPGLKPVMVAQDRSADQCLAINLTPGLTIRMESVITRPSAAYLFTESDEEE